MKVIVELHDGMKLEKEVSEFDPIEFAEYINSKNFDQVIVHGTSGFMKNAMKMFRVEE